MTDLTESDATLLRRLAVPDMDGVLGAAKGLVLDTLLSAGLVRIGFVPAEHLTEDCAWVAVTEAGHVWLAAHV